MTQSIEQRRYWARKRSEEEANSFKQRMDHLFPSSPREIVFLATTMKEYNDLKRDHLGARITLELTQLNLLGDE